MQSKGERASEFCTFICNCNQSIIIKGNFDKNGISIQKYPVNSIWLKNQGKVYFDFYLDIFLHGTTTGHLQAEGGLLVCLNRFQSKGSRQNRGGEDSIPFQSLELNLGSS